MHASSNAVFSEIINRSTRLANIIVHNTRELNNLKTEANEAHDLQLTTKVLTSASIGAQKILFLPSRQEE